MACAMCAWRLLLLAALPALVGVGAEVEAGPAFLPTRRALAAAPGGEAVLVCRVARLGDKAVSWVRARDLHILAHDGAVFSADPRVSARAARGAGAVTHTLRIAPLRASDAGRYECQLNTDPKLSQVYNLTVAEKAWHGVEVEALGATRVSAAAGRVATLGCVGRLRPAAPDPPALRPAAPDPPALRVTWYRDGEPLLPQDGALSGASLDTERAAGRVTARLTLAALRPAHAARYVCRVSADADADAGEEHALQGEAAITLVVTEDTSLGEMEAMQRDQSPAPGAACAPRPAPAPALAALATLAAMAALPTLAAPCPAPAPALAALATMAALPTLAAPCPVPAAALAVLTTLAVWLTLAWHGRLLLAPT